MKIKNNEWTHTHFKVDKENYDKLRDIADKNGMKVYFIINKLIEEYVKTRSNK